MFDDDLLFTHRGLSGPAALQASTYWREGEPVTIDLRAGDDLGARLTAAKATRRKLGPSSPSVLPRRLGEAWLEAAEADRPRGGDAATASSPTWPPGCGAGASVPTGTEGYRKAEVTAGGVDTRDLDSRSLQSRLVPGLHFIGEVVDVTGWLGGYNFQWAWASAAACARALAADCSHRAWRAIIFVFPKYRRSGRQPRMTTVRVKENEPFDVALRRFKRTIEKLGLLTDLRAREFYEKPTAERKRKKAAAVKRHFKRVRSMQLPKKLF